MIEKSSDSVWVTPAQCRVLANAERLLQDAELLFEKGRYPSAMSLAILAFEEIGKVYLIGLEGSELKKGSKASGHREKQQYALGLLIASPAIAAFVEYLKSLGSPMTVEGAAALLFAIIKAAGDAESEEDKAAFVHARDVIEREIMARLKSTEVSKVAGIINSGDANIMKQLGLYYDIDSSGAVISDPMMIGKEQAEYWLDRAKFVVAFCKVSSARAKIPTS